MQVLAQLELGYGPDKTVVRLVVQSCLGDSTVDDSGVAQCVEGPDHDPEVTDRDVGTFDEDSRGGHI